MSSVETKLSPITSSALGITILTLIWIILPFAIISVHNFYQLKTTNIYKNRYGELVVPSTILLMIYIGIATPLYVIPNAFPQSLSHSSLLVIRSLFLLLYPYCSHCALWLILTRFWLTYFDFSWTKATLNSEWKVHINPEGSSKTEEWFLKNKSKYGNLKIMRHKALIISLMTATFTAIGFQIALFTKLWRITFVQFFDFLFYITPAITLLIIWKKIPAVYDIMFYRAEMKRLGFSILFTTLINYFVFLLVAVMVHDDVISMFYCGLFVMFHCYTLILFQTMYVLNKIKTSKQMNFGYINKKENNSSVIMHRIASASASNVRKNSQQTSTNKSLLLSSILANKQSFDLFMQHLSAEFSMECLLGFVELSQFTILLQSDKEFMTNINVDKGSDDLVSQCAAYQWVKLPFTTPQSIIVYKNRSEMEGNIKYLQIAKDLNDKYICVGSEFELNLSGTTRYGVKYWLESNDTSGDMFEEHLYVLFDQVRKELYKLMNHSCHRFVMSDTFKKIESELISQNV